MHIQNQSLTLQAGDIIYLSTDGLADQNNENRKKFGVPTLKKILEEIYEQDMPAQLKYVQAYLDQHQRQADQRDDITLLGVRLA